MLPTPDPHCVIGARVHALAWHGTSFLNALGGLVGSKGKYVTGNLKDVRTDKSGGRARTFITAEYEFEGGQCKAKELSLCSVIVNDASALPAMEG